LLAKAQKQQSRHRGYHGKKTFSFLSSPYRIAHGNPVIPAKEKPSRKLEHNYCGSRLSFLSHPKWISLANPG
jgi:hypothetical protein